MNSMSVDKHRSAISYECPTEFNVLTNLKSCDEYRKELQESTDPLKYRFDIRPGPMCYMPGQAFQGLQFTSSRNPPPQLLDMEMTLQAMPLKEEDNRYVTKDIHNAVPPKMPAILSNRLVIPDCRDILQWQRTKIRRIDFPQISQRMDKMGLYLTNYMRPGRDTRAEMRDAFKLYEKQNAAKGHIYGVGKFDSRALKPGTNTKCTNASDIDCMNVYGPEAIRTSAVVDSTLPLTDLNIPGNVLKENGTAAAASNTKPSALRAEAMRVASTINPNVPYINMVEDMKRQNSCNARFYGYTPPPSCE